MDTARNVNHLSNRTIEILATHPRRLATRVEAAWSLRFADAVDWVERDAAFGNELQGRAAALRERLNATPARPDERGSVQQNLSDMEDAEVQEVATKMYELAKEFILVTDGLQRAAQAMRDSTDPGGSGVWCVDSWYPDRDEADSVRRFHLSEGASEAHIVTHSETGNFGILYLAASPHSPSHGSGRL
jgi:hypothetical protein